MKSLALLEPNLSEVLGDARLTCFFFIFLFFSFQDAEIWGWGCVIAGN